MIFPHDHWIEWTWFLGAMACILFSIWNLIWCVQTQTALDLAGINGRGRIAMAIHTRAELFRLFAGVLSICGASIAIMAAPPLPPYSSMPQSLTSVIAWNGLTITLLVWSALDRKSRQQVVNYSREAYQARTDGHPIPEVPGTDCGPA